MMAVVQRMTMQTKSEDGQALAEYALIMAFIAIICAGTVAILGLAISGGFGSIAGSF